MGDATLVRTVYRTLLREGKVLDREPALKYLLLRPTLFLRSSAGAARSFAPIFAAPRPTAKPQQVDTYSVVDELSTEFFGYKETLFYNPAIARQRSVVSFLTDVFHRHKDEPDQLKKERLIDAAFVAIREIGRCVSAGKKYGIDTSLFGPKENTPQQHPQEPGQQDSTDETASTTRMLQKGTVLIAHPNLEGDAFKRSAVLLYDYNTKSGAKGIILNNPFVDEGKLQTVESIIRHQLLYRDRANALKARRRTLVEQSESENAEDGEDEDEDENEGEGDLEDEEAEEEKEEAEQEDEEDNLVRLASEYGARPIQYGGPVPYQQPVNGHLFFLHSYSRHLPTPEGNNVKEAEQVAAKQQQTEERVSEAENEEEEEEEARRGMASHQIKCILPSGVYCGGDPFRLSRNAWKNKEEKEESAEKNIHFFLGHSVWSPGQLEAEFKQGSWMLASLSPAMIFSVLQTTKNVTNDVQRKRHRDGFWAKVLRQMEPEHSAMAKLVVSRPTEEK